MRVILLGTAAGGGYPQWNCACAGCDAARRTGPARLQDTVAVSGDGQAWYLLNASPDVRAQILAIAAKWLLIWRYRPCEKPLWSTFVWRNELLNALHEHLAEPALHRAAAGLNRRPFCFAGRTPKCPLTRRPTSSWSREPLAGTACSR